MIDEIKEEESNEKQTISSGDSFIEAFTNYIKDNPDWKKLFGNYEEL